MISPRIIHILTLFALLSYSASKPIIAIVSNQSPTKSTGEVTSSLIWGGYVRWLEQAGAILIPIHSWYSTNKIDWILARVNGIFFMGNNRRINLNYPFEKASRDVFERAVELNKKGDYFPIWGTCFGYELFFAATANSNAVIGKYRSNNIYEPSDWLPAAYDSKLFSNFENKDFDMLAKTNSTFQIHRRGSSQADFDRFSNMKDFWVVTSYAQDADGKKFINSVESKAYPIFGVQYHPEVNPNARSKGHKAEHTMEAMRISQLHAMKFVDETRKNKHVMTEEEIKRIGRINTYGKGCEMNYEKFYYNFNKEEKETW